MSSGPTNACSNTPETEETSICNCLRWSSFSRRRKPACNPCSCGFWCCHRYPRQRIPNENLLILSIIQVLCGTASVILASVAVTRELYLYQLGTGLWSGVVMLATGMLGVVTARQKRLCTIISLLVFCVLSSISAILLTIHSVVGLIHDGLHPDSSRSSFIMDFRTAYTVRSTLIENNIDTLAVARSRTGPVAHMVIMHSLLLIVSLLELSVGVTTAIIVCRQVCCGQVHYVSGRTVLVTGQSDLINPRSRNNIVERRSNHLSNRNPLFIPLHSTSTPLCFNNNVSGQGFPLSASLSLLDNASHVNDVNRSTCASMLYILQSPTRDDTALVFPAFPPAYTSSSQHSTDTSPMQDNAVNRSGNVSNNPVASSPMSSVTAETCVDSAFISHNSMGFRPVVLIHSAPDHPPPEYSTLDRRSHVVSPH